MKETMSFLRTIQKCPPRGQGTIIDIGANIGVTSIGMIHTGEVERAVAIEPEPANFSLLKHNVKQNGLEDRIICLQNAVSDIEGEIEFELSDTNFGDHRIRSGHQDDTHQLYSESKRRVISVHASSLDKIMDTLPEQFLKSIAVIWIDVQGFEGYVFRGGMKLLSSGIPVMSEIWPYGIRRSGMSQDQFIAIAKSIWSSYWVMQQGRFVRYPIDDLDSYITGLGYDGSHENVIFTN